MLSVRMVLEVLCLLLLELELADLCAGTHAKTTIDQLPGIRMDLTRVAFAVRGHNQTATSPKKKKRTIESHATHLALDLLLCWLDGHLGGSQRCSRPRCLCSLLVPVPAVLLCNPFVEVRFFLG